MRPMVVAGIGAAFVIVGAVGLGMGALRYETTNMDRGVTAVLDHWTGNVTYCRIGQGCVPMTKAVQLTIEQRCVEDSRPIDARDPNAADDLLWRIKNCPPTLRQGE